MKPKGWIKLNRASIEKEKILNDREFRLLYLYARIVDWDHLHENFASTDVSIRKIKELYLPNWSIGKISTTTCSLINKSLLLRHKRRIYVLRMNPNVQKLKPSVQNSEQSVLSSEHSSENRGKEYQIKKQELLNKFENPVQLSKHDLSDKEN